MNFEPEYWKYKGRIVYRGSVAITAADDEHSEVEEDTFQLDGRRRE